MSRDSHDDRGARSAEGQVQDDFVLLEDVCRRLGVSRQGVVNLLEESGIRIERIRRGGRTLSGIDRLDLERLQHAPAAEPDAGPDLWSQLQRRETAKELELAEARERLRRTEIQLAEARADLEVAERTTAQLERVTVEAAEAQKTIVELTHRLGALEASLHHTEGALAKRDEDLANLRRRCQKEREALAAELQEERARNFSVREELEEVRGLLMSLERQLRLARQVEAANGKYLDRMEEKLLAARHTARFLRRRRA
jgi:chromosome segregation ATPase